MTNPLTLIEQADKEFSEKFDLTVIEDNVNLAYLAYNTKRKENDQNLYSIDAVLEDIKSHFHQLLLSIAEGECERLEGMKRKLPESGRLEDLTEDDFTEKGTLQRNKKSAQDYGEYIGYNSALSDSLEHWKEIIKFLESK